jgi:hypothetical protein
VVVCIHVCLDAVVKADVGGLIVVWLHEEEILVHGMTCFDWGGSMERDERDQRVGSRLLYLSGQEMGTLGKRGEMTPVAE